MYTLRMKVRSIPSSRMVTTKRPHSCAIHSLVEPEIDTSHIEMWNSYTSDIGRPVRISINRLAMSALDKEVKTAMR